MPDTFHLDLEPPKGGKYDVNLRTWLTRLWNLLHLFYNRVFSSTSNGIDHGSLSGLTDDDHPQYLVKANATAVRNTITPSADVVAETIQVGATADALQVIKTASVVAKITNGGKVFGAGLDAGAARGTNFLDPVSDQDAATKKYVDTGNTASAAYADAVVLAARSLRFTKQTAASEIVANTTTETAFASLYTIPANTLEVGDLIRVVAYGVYSTAVLAPTIRGRLYLDDGTPVAMLDTGALTVVAGATNKGWRAEGSLVCTDAPPKIDAQGIASFATAATAALSAHIANTGVITAPDFGNAMDIYLTITWGAASASNTIQLLQLNIEILKLKP